MGRHKKPFFHVGSILSSVHDGDFKVIDDYSWDCVYIEFLKTGYKSCATRDQIKNGTVNDRLKPTVCGVGYIGGTKYKSKNGKITNRVYTRWSHMIKRCYDSKTQKKMPSYIGCSVCPEWLNFQVYAEWCEEHEIPGFDLDKDILVEGNKVYSPLTCKFVTRQENAEKALAGYYMVICPKGESLSVYNLEKFCREKGLTSKNMRSVIAGRRNHHKGYTAPKY